jgi:AcrR family transcriptional regulator
METSERLLEAACRVFAEKGFHHATIAEICELAGANIAAVNYHFNSKENLYVQSWHYSFKKGIESYPPDGGVSAEASPEEKFKGRVSAILHRIADPEAYFFEIIDKELSNPTGLLTGAKRQAIEPIKQGMSEIIGQLLGGGASEKEIVLCRMSVMSQCFHWMLRQKRSRRSPSDRKPMERSLLETLSLEELTDHIVRFSLGALREIRRDNQKNTSQ